MAKRIKKKRKRTSSTTNLKADKLKLDAQDRQNEKSRLREEQALRRQMNKELKILEHQLREEKLKPTCAMLSELSQKKYEHDRIYCDEQDWKHRLRCDGTPNPRVVQELNTYLFVSRQMTTHTGDEQNAYIVKCLEIFNIMDAVEDNVDIPLDFNEYKLQCFREARDNLGRLLVEIVYEACYHLLSDYDVRMYPVDLETVTYQKTCKAFAVGMHAVCHRPRLKTDDRPPPKCDFPECLVAVDVPPQLSQEYMAVMALWLHWDAFTDRMAVFDVSKSPELDTRDLWQYSIDRWIERNQITQEINEEKERKEREWWVAKMEERLKLFADIDPSQYSDDLKAFIDEQEKNNASKFDMINEYIEEEQISEEYMVFISKEEPQKQVDTISTKFMRNEFQKTASQEIEKRELEKMEDISNSLKYPEKPNELNPRKFCIIGGAFNVEMWKLPMQPVELRDNTVVVMLIGPSALQPIDYHEKYEPIQLSMDFSSTSLQDEETDVKKQNQKALERLTLISIKLPENVLWFENPKPAMWNEDRKVWTTDYIYDVGFNEEKQTVSFRAGRMGSFGLAVNQYSNFPYQSWEIRPEGTGGGVVISLTAATVLVEFVVRGDLAAMVQLQNTATVALQDMIGVYLRPESLVRLLRRGGVNLFPWPDASHYVTDGRRQPKHAVVERHTYRCMAALSGTHRFTASRWNERAPADRIVFQMTEIPASETGVDGDDTAATTPCSTVMVTPERAVLLKCDEDSQTFPEEPLSGKPGVPFTPDLYALATETVASTGRQPLVTVPTDFRTMETLFYLMDKIKFLSYT